MSQRRPRAPYGSDDSRALEYGLCLEEVEADAPEAMILGRKRGGGVIWTKDTTYLEKSTFLHKWSYDSLSSSAPRRIVGALQVPHSTEE